MSVIKTFTSQFINLSNESIKDLESIYSYKKYKKGEIIISVGKIQKSTFLLTEGIARSYVTDKNGRDHIRTIFTPTSIVCSMSSLVQKTPSNSSYDCITDCILLEANWNEFIALTEKHHDLAILYYKTLEDAFVRIEHRITSLSVLNATERYIQLKEKAPNIQNQIPLYQIAAYLNITPIQLSRIRKELYSK